MLNLKRLLLHPILPSYLNIDCTECMWSHLSLLKELLVLFLYVGSASGDGGVTAALGQTAGLLHDPVQHALVQHHVLVHTLKGYSKGKEW